MLENEGTVVVPTPTLAETITGDAGRDAETNRVLAVLVEVGHILVAPDESTGRRAGKLRYRARTDDGIDALVAAAAVGDGSSCVVLTSDPHDLRKLLAAEPSMTVQKV